MKKKIILDVDTGTDDAVAVMLAALHPDIELLGVTTVWGNLPIDNTTDNSLRVLDYIGRSDVEVHRGMGKPFAPHPYMKYQRTRANDINDKSKPNMHPPALSLPDPTSAESPMGAIDWIVSTVRAASDPVTLVAVAPLSNIAAAVTVAPDIVAKIDELVIMGGGNAFGNVTPAAEGNIWCDPIAADVVFQAGFERLVLMPLDATHKAAISEKQSSILRALNTRAGIASADAIDQRIKVHAIAGSREVGNALAPVHDPLCIAYLLEPDVVTLHHVNVAVDVTSIVSIGATVIDVHSASFDPPNAYVALDANSDQFFEIMRATFANSERV